MTDFSPEEIKAIGLQIVHLDKTRKGRNKTTPTAMSTKTTRQL
jgi:hypothetical protein